MVARTGVLEVATATLVVSAPSVALTLTPVAALSAASAIVAVLVVAKLLPPASLTETVTVCEPSSA